MKFQSQFGSERTGIQLAPMIDVVFLLLIFFIVLWNYARFETEIDISVPAASAGENPERTIGEIVVNVNKEELLPSKELSVPKKRRWKCLETLSLPIQIKP